MVNSMLRDFWHIKIKELKYLTETSCNFLQYAATLHILIEKQKRQRDEERKCTHKNIESSG